MNLADKSCMLPMCAMILMALVSSFLGVVSIYTPPFDIKCTPILNIFYRCVFLSFAPCPVLLLAFEVQDRVPFLLFKHGPVTR